MRLQRVSEIIGRHALTAISNASAPGAAWSSALKNYVLAALVVVAVISYIDRQIITILLESIKLELGVSDTQMGMLTGVYFAAFYVLAGIPLARFADRGNRRSLIAVCLATWSAATAACGLAQHYWHLAIARMLVATGEAGSAPATYSLLSDLFPATVRTRVFALISCGSAVGIAFGIFLGGTLHEALGWRMVFFAVGVPGILFAALLWLTVPEPPRTVVQNAEPTPSIFAALGEFWRIPSFRYLTFIAILAAGSAYAVLAWMPTFLVRVHGMSTGEIGVQMGLATVLGLILGNISCGILADVLGKTNRRWLIWVAGVGLILCVPLGLLAAYLANSIAVIVAFGFFMYFLGFWAPPVMTCVVGVVDQRSKALGAATIPIFQAIGGAIGPLFIGAMNDALAPQHGELAVRYSLALSLGGCAIAGVLCLLAGPQLARDYRASSQSFDPLTSKR